MILFLSAGFQWLARPVHTKTCAIWGLGLLAVCNLLLMATTWVLASAHGQPATDWPLWLLTAATAVLVWRTRLHLLWLLGAGALAGALGWV